LALLEIYRDVKTGHPHEAIEIFDRKQKVLRRQLGHRAGDAYALAARAHDLAGNSARAQEEFEKATMLAPMIELKRRYPEIGAMEGKYREAARPAEVVT
jgi:hypothetical protein